MTHERLPPQGIPASPLVSARLALQRWRRRMKARLPWVRRSVHRRLEARYQALLAATWSAPPAEACSLVAVKAPPGELGPEACLFVTYSPLPRLKRHVVRHVEALRRAGVQVILVVNTPLPPERLELDPAFLDALGGLYVRGNQGFDFGAWAQAWLALRDRLVRCERVLLTNDSIVGPLGDGPFQALLDRIRRSTADVLGLTENAEVRYHLQSFFLVFQRGALASAELERFWRGVRNLPAKELVVDLYEAQLTGLLAAAGLRCEPLFRLPGSGPAGANEAYLRWEDLVESGCPFVKASVLEGAWGSAAIERIVPREIRDGYEFANARAAAASRP